MPRPKAPNKFRRWTFTLPAELLGRLNAAAERLREEGHDVSSAALCRRALDRYLDELESKNRVPTSLLERRNP